MFDYSDVCLSCRAVLARLAGDLPAPSVHWDFTWLELGWLSFLQGNKPTLAQNNTALSSPPVPLSLQEELEAAESRD